MAVQQHVLNWLYSVLTSEYHDVNRTYNDVAQALSQYPSLSPRTDVHTFPNGASALLVHLSGTIPVLFRGTTYRFPISLWVPHAYPREAPLVYVTPTESMMVRPGQHVDPQGQIYHPYLVGWSEFWDKSSIRDFLAILRDVFAKEPPVIARQGGRPPPGQQATASPPPVPPLPPHMAPHPPSQSQSPHMGQEAAPAPPPKSSGPPLHRPSPVPAPREGPPSNPQQPAQPQYGPGMPSNTFDSRRASAGNRMSRYDSAPPLPPEAGVPAPRPLSQGVPPPTVGRPPYQPQPPPHQQQYQPGPSNSAFQQADPRRMSGFPASQQQFSQQQPPPPQWQQPPPTLQPQPKPRAPPPPDIMDEPLTLAIPSPSNVPAPPIPPNPEKDALLHQLASTLHTMRQRSRAQNESSLAGLQTQRTAMISALNALQAEADALAGVSGLLTSNTTILREALRTADGVVENSARQAAPGIDELLVAPTVVANQLYELVAEERALGDAIFVLGRAVERGRMSPAVFAKTTRSLAREWFLKKALVKKIGKGMGLTA